jgi:transcription elongation factor GreA
MMAHYQPAYVTAKGLAKIIDELEYLCNVERVEMAEQLSETQSGGDHLDNTEFQYAYYAKLLLDKRIEELRRLLANAQLIEHSCTDGIARIGSTVTIEDDQRQLETYVIVGPLEANPSDGLISDQCPLGQALLNRSVGDHVTVYTPDGVTYYRLVAVS